MSNNAQRTRFETASIRLTPQKDGIVIFDFDADAYGGDNALLARRDAELKAYANNWMQRQNASGQLVGRSRNRQAIEAYDNLGFRYVGYKFIPVSR